MTKLITLICCLCFLGLTSCKNEKKAESDETIITIDMAEDEDSKTDLSKSEKSGDCDDFMDDYEQWMERYIELMGKYKDNPVGLASSPEYTSMSMEMMEWSSKWSSLAIDCAKYPKYEKRFNKIQKKADKELEALGIN